MLTRKQKELLLFIHASVAKEGLTPSFDEMRTALGLRSKSGIHRLITGLEERGFIKRLPHRARALEVLRLPGGEELGKAASKAVKKIKTATRAAASFLTLPLYGRIAAGTPIEAISAARGEMGVPFDLLANARGGLSGEHYVLEVAGDSMIEAGIMDGDHVIIRRADTADNGAIVVALVDEGEATLKYFERKKDEVVLKPANACYEPRSFPSNRVRVQGRLVGLLRRY